MELIIAISFIAAFIFIIVGLVASTIENRKKKEMQNYKPSLIICLSPFLISLILFSFLSYSSWAITFKQCSPIINQTQINENITTYTYQDHCISYTVKEKGFAYLNFTFTLFCLLMLIIYALVLVM